MKRLVALILVVFISTFTLVGCLRPTYVKGDEYLGFEFAQNVNAKVESDEFIFDKNDVTLDLFYCFYCLDNLTIEQVKDRNDFIIREGEQGEDIYHIQYTYAVYISKNKELIFEEDDLGTLIDYKNKVNARLLKYITHEESFNINYGFTSSGLKINYNHSEKLTIPAELFDLSSDCVYIHVARFWYDVDNDTLSATGEKAIVEIKYRLLGNNTVRLLNH